MLPIVVVNERIVGLHLQTVAVGGYHGAQKSVLLPNKSKSQRIWYISGSTERTFYAADRLNGFKEILKKSDLGLLYFQHCIQH